MKSATKLNVLYLVHRVPYPPNRGDRIRSYHLLKFLAEQCNVHLATLADEPVAAETRNELARLCARVEIAPVGSMRWACAGWSLARGRSATEGLFCVPRLKTTVDQWARSIRFDAVLAFCSSMVQYADIPSLANVPLVCDLVDVDSQKWLDYAATAPSPLGTNRGLGSLTFAPKRWLFQLEGARLRRLESSLPKRSRAVTFVSEAEAQLFREFCPNSRTLAIGNGVDLDYFRPLEKGSSLTERGAGNDPASFDCVFVGVLDYRANVDGLAWFCRHVWPRVRERLPAATFGLIGRNPAPAVRGLDGIPGVRVIGAVPDIRPYLSAAKFVIAPLRIARGIQNKVLEAMAMQRAVLASPAAAEGIDVTDGEELLVARSPQEWAASFCRLCEDAPLREKIGLAARDYVERNHLWAHNLQSFAELLGLPAPSSNRAAPAVSHA